MNFNKRTITTLSIFLLASFLLAPIVAATGDLPDLPPDIGIWTAISRITQFVFGVLLAVSILFIILAGFYFVTASGNDEQINKARSMLMYAVIGIVVALLSTTIVNYVAKLLGVDLDAISSLIHLFV